MISRVGLAFVLVVAVFSFLGIVFYCLRKTIFTRDVEECCLCECECCLCVDDSRAQVPAQPQHVPTSLHLEQPRDEPLQYTSTVDYWLDLEQQSKEYLIEHMRLVCDLRQVVDDYTIPWTSADRFGMRITLAEEIVFLDQLFHPRELLDSSMLAVDGRLCDQEVLKVDSNTLLRCLTKMQAMADSERSKMFRRREHSFNMFRTVDHPYELEFVWDMFAASRRLRRWNRIGIMIASILARFDAEDVQHSVSELFDFVNNGRDMRCRLVFVPLRRNVLNATHNEVHHDETTHNEVHHDETTHNEAQCSVCLDTISAGNRFALPCGHNTFHAACIQRWLQTATSCPLCRTSAV